MDNNKIYHQIGIAIYAAIIGLLVGLTMYVFNFAVDNLSSFRANNPTVIYFLPFAGLIIVFIYTKLKITAKAGSGMFFKRVQKLENTNMKNAVAVFVSACLSHLFGASVGKTNASLQIGGAIGDFFSLRLKLTHKEKRCLVMCGVAASFASLFNTPIAAAIFAIEVTTIGKIYYKSFIPCLISAIISFFLNHSVFAINLDYSISNIPSLNPENTIKVIGLCIVLALIAVILCETISKTIKFFNQFRNKYAKIMIAGILVLSVYLLFGNEYAGSGNNLIATALTTKMLWYAFIIKIIVTAISAAGGYQGGMVSPTLSIGALSGSMLGQIFGLSNEFCVCIGMLCLFVGVINAKICGIVLAIEMFGFNAIVFYLIAIFIADQLSLNFKIFNDQEFSDDKFLIKKIKHLVGKEKNESIN